MWICKCGRTIPNPKNPDKGHLHVCSCGRMWLWKIRSRKYVYAGGGACGGGCDKS